MTAALSIQRLYDVHRHKLGLSGLDSDTHTPASLDVNGTLVIEPGMLASAMVGHINPIRQCLVQVFGQLELTYFSNLDAPGRDHFLQLVLAGKPACIIVADDLEVPGSLIRAWSPIPIIKAQSSSHHVVTELLRYLARANAPLKSLHGVFIEVLGVGVLLCGPAGIGKSELALELISRGHRLIADDAPEFVLFDVDNVVGSCPETLRDFIEVRGLGIINVRSLFGDSAVKSHRSLRLIISLELADEKSFSPEQRLDGIHSQREVHGVNIPEMTLPVAPGHSMAVLVETMVRNFILRSKGYDAAEDLAARLNESMKKAL